MQHPSQVTEAGCSLPAEGSGGAGTVDAVRLLVLESQSSRVKRRIAEMQMLT